MAPSVRDIAKQAGVSIATVSRALNSHPDISVATRERVIKTASRVGYTTRSPKATKVTGNNMSIAFAATTGGRVASTYDSHLIYGMQEALAQYTSMGLALLDLRDKGEAETYQQFCRRKGIGGLILRTNTQNRDVCEKIVSEGVPALVVAERFDRGDMNFLVCESRSASHRAVEHLIQVGHQRIALVIHRRDDGDHADREAGYREALEAAGIEIDPSLIIRLVPNLESGANAINQLLSLPNPPTGIYFTDPEPTIGAMCRAHEFNLRIPQDLSIIGFDDSASRYQMFPRITAVCQDTHELGGEAARWMCDRLVGHAEEPMQRVIPAFLEINQTTGAPPAEPVRLLPNGQRIS